MQQQTTATVLLVEDDELVATATRLQLESSGYEVLGPVGTAEDALACIARTRPDLVLMDIQLQGAVDGIEAAGHMREQGIPVAFLTAHTEDAVLQRARSVRPIAYLIKPVDRHQLLATVTTALEQLRLQRDLEEMRKRARASEQQLSTLIRSLPGMIYRGRHDGGRGMLYASEGCLGLTGYAAEEFVSTAVCYADLIHGEDRRAVFERIDTAVAERRPYRLVYRMRDRLGREKWVWEQGRGRFNPEGELEDLEGLIIDISDQKHIEQALEASCSDLEERVELRTIHLTRLNEELQERIHERGSLNMALRQSEDRYRNLVETVNDWVWEVNAQGVYIYASPRVRDLLGYTPEEVVGRTPFDLMPEDEARRVADEFARIVAEQAPIERLENINLHKDGHAVVLETSAMPVIVDGVLMGYRGVDRDITERKEMESALRASEARLSAILRHTMAVTYLKDADGRYLMANPAFERITGLSACDIIGRTDREIFPAEIAERFRDHDRRILEWKRSETFEEELNIAGERHIFLSVKFPVYDSEGSGNAICSMSTDITDRLRQAEQERDVLVREVHHRIKNHLQGVIGLLRQQQVSVPELMDVMDNVVGKVQSIATVYGIKSRSNFSRLSLQTMLGAICGQVQDLAQAEIRCGTDMQQENGVGIAPEESVPLALILNELLVNAVKHSVPSGDGPGYIEVRLDRFGDGLLVCICNEGTLPAALDWEAGRGLGTGLRLLRSLMPHKGAGLRYRQSGNQVITEFLLVEPLLQTMPSSGVGAVADTISIQ